MAAQKPEILIIWYVCMIATYHRLLICVFDLKERVGLKCKTCEDCEKVQGLETETG